MDHHEYSKLFPMLNESDLQQLADDIRVHGLREPIVIDDNDEILDGRNREAACVIAGVKPHYEPFVGDDEQKLAFIVSANIHRRHLTTRQRAMVAGKLKPIYEAQAAKRQTANLKKGSKAPVPANLPEREKGDARDKAAAAFNVSGKSVDQACKVIAKAVPEIVAAVDSGALSVSAAAIVADMPEWKQKELIESGVAAVREAAAESRMAELEVLPSKFSSDDFDAVKAGLRIRKLIHKEMENWPADRRGEAAQTFSMYLGKFEDEPEISQNVSVAEEPTVPESPNVSGVLFPDAVEDMQAMERREQREPSEDPFDVFYKIFPKKVNKLKARAAFNKARAKLLNKHGRSSIVESIIIEGAKVYAERANPEYLCLPTTWLNGDRWEDDPEDIWTGDRPKEKSGNATFGTYSEEERAQLQDAVF
jgi:ParB-like chromosome segregation protein Spo0J